MACKGYQGYGPNYGVFVPAQEALDYALERSGVVQLDPEAPELADFLEAVVNWFYSRAYFPVEEDYDEKYCDPAQ